MEKVLPSRYLIEIMPELPEAETIARALDQALKNRRIEKVEIFFPKLRSSLEPLMSANLEGRRITGCRRRARYAVLSLDDGRFLMLHFGMSGVVRVVEDRVPRKKHEHVVISIDGGEQIRFEDPRRFGSVEICEAGADGWPRNLADLGVEPLDAAFSAEYLFEKSRQRRIPVKELIMDNKVVVGIGNIYAAETLFAARVSPLKKAHRLTLDECREIVSNSKRILRLAIKWGGSTIHDYRHVDGSEGKFSQKLLIYGKKECPVCGGEVLHPVIGGRTSWYCPNCQNL